MRRRVLVAQTPGPAFRGDESQHHSIWPGAAQKREPAQVRSEFRRSWLRGEENTSSLASNGGRWLVDVN